MKSKPRLCSIKEVIKILGFSRRHCERLISELEPIPLGTGYRHMPVFYWRRADIEKLKVSLK